MTYAIEPYIATRLEFWLALGKLSLWLKYSSCGCKLLYPYLNILLFAPRLRTESCQPSWLEGTFSHSGPTLMIFIHM